MSVQWEGRGACPAACFISEYRTALDLV